MSIDLRDSELLVASCFTFLEISETIKLAAAISGKFFCFTLGSLVKQNKLHLFCTKIKNLF